MAECKPFSSRYLNELFACRAALVMSLRLKTLFGSAETNLFLPARFRLEPEIGRRQKVRVYG